MLQQGELAVAYTSCALGQCVRRQYTRFPAVKMALAPEPLIYPNVKKSDRIFFKHSLCSAGETVLRPIQVADADPPAPAVKPSSADGSDFLSAAAARTTGGKPAASAAVVDAMVFCPCPAVDGASASSCSARSDRGFADIGEHMQ